MVGDQSVISWLQVKEFRTLAYVCAEPLSVNMHPTYLRRSSRSSSSVILLPNHIAYQSPTHILRPHRNKTFKLCDFRHAPLDLPCQ